MAERVLNGLFNKVTLGNLFTIQPQIRKAIEEHGVQPREFIALILKNLDVSVKVPDFQILTLAGLLALVVPLDHVHTHMENLNLAADFSNLRNIFRFLSFLYHLDVLTCQKLLSIFKKEFSESDQRLELSIDFIQLNGQSLRKNYPKECAEIIEFILAHTDESSSRGKFQREIISDLKSNAQKLVKKIDIPELTILMSSLAEQKPLANNESGSKMSSRKLSQQDKIFKLVIESVNLEDAKCRLAAFMMDKSFDRDFLNACLKCIDKEKVYNPFYANLAACILDKRYRLKRYIRLHYGLFLKDVESYQTRTLIYRSKFFSHFFAMGILTLRNLDVLFGTKFSDRQALILCICISVIKTDAQLTHFIDGENPEKLHWLHENRSSLVALAEKMKLGIPKFLD